MALSLRPAERKKVKLKIGITAPSGHGKTFSALLLARGLASSWEKVCLIDTEDSGDKYAGHPELGPFQVIPLFESNHPDRFSPSSWIQAMKLAIDHGIEAIVLDSATHEWQWCLDYQKKIGGTFRDWKKVTPEHDKFIRAIIRCPIHVVVCLRRKTEYAISQEVGEKSKVEKVGMKSETREGFEYELDILFGLNRQHMATVEKDRTGLLSERVDFVLTEETGRELLAWSQAEIPAGAHGDIMI